MSDAPDFSALDDAAVAALGEDLPLLEGIRTTRAIRRLKPDPVPRALIRKICEAGTFAPSGGNRRSLLTNAAATTAQRSALALSASAAPAPS